MTFVYPGQPIVTRVRFPVPLDSAPTLSTFVNGVSVVNSVDVSGSGAVWVFSYSVPGNLVAPNKIQAEAAGDNGGVPVYVQVLDATVAQWETLTGPPAIEIPPSVNPLTSTGYCLCLDKNGDAEPGVLVSLQMIAGPGDDGYSYNAPVKRAISGANGVAVIEGNVRGSTIEVWRGRVAGRSRKQRVVVPNEATFQLPETL